MVLLVHQDDQTITAITTSQSSGLHGILSSELLNFSFQSYFVNKAAYTRRGIRPQWSKQNSIKIFASLKVCNGRMLRMIPFRGVDIASIS